MSTRANKLVLIVASLALAALALSACGSKHAAPAVQTPAVNVPAGLAALLPPLPPADGHSPAKAGSAAQTGFIGGISLYTGSSGYGTQGSSLTLPSQPGGVEWGEYLFNLTGSTLSSVEPNVTAQTGVAYVAISDYAKGAWRFLGATAGPTKYNIPPGTYADVNGKCYLLVLTWNGDSALHNFTVLRYDDGTTQGAKISGTIVDENSQPLGGVEVDVAPGFLLTFTDSDGKYMLSVPADDTYTLTPSLSGYTFTPATLDAVVNAGLDVSGKDFSGASLDIRGKILDGATPVANVKVSLASGYTAYTLADGSYLFQGVLPGMDTVTPKLPGYTFNPPNIQVSVVATDLDNQDFAATSGQPTYTISGHVLDAQTSTPINNALVSLKPDDLYVHTDAGGLYTFTDLAPDDYVLNAYQQGYKVTPTDVAVQVTNANVTGKDFSAQMYYDLTGTLKGSGGFPLAGINVTIMPGGFTTATDNGGVYHFYNLVPNTYTVTPANALYTFNPLSAQVVITTGLGQAADMTGALTGTVTYNNRIGLIVSERCLSCHQPAGNPSVDPDLRTYNDMVTWGAASNSRVQNGTMPPGNPLSGQLKEQFSKWIAGGKPQS